MDFLQIKSPLCYYNKGDLALKYLFMNSLQPLMACQKNVIRTGAGFTTGPDGPGPGPKIQGCSKL